MHKCIIIIIIISSSSSSSINNLHNYSFIILIINACDIGLILAK
jgi:hypothetical protein